jgi:cytochrome c oxidase assembly protein subunit 11
MSSKQSVKRTAIMLMVLTSLMFGFGYAMVPLYDVFCKITGINGKTQKVDQDAEAGGAVLERDIKILFDSNINGDLPWKLLPHDRSMRAHPGKYYEAVFTVTNLSDKPIVGQAVPSVTPQIASLYFKKAECFCFTNQLLEPNETKDMLVRFEVDKDLPKNVEEISLSYTFFRVKKESKLILDRKNYGS